MNLEQIDTSTTAGKAEVMRLAAEGKTVVYLERGYGLSEWKSHARWQEPQWDWLHIDYAIIADPVGPEKLWVSEYCGKHYCHKDKHVADRFVSDSGGEPTLYIRADLAGENKA